MKVGQIPLEQFNNIRSKMKNTPPKPSKEILKLAIDLDLYTLPVEERIKVLNHYFYTNNITKVVAKRYFKYYEHIKLIPIIPPILSSLSIEKKQIRVIPQKEYEIFINYILNQAYEFNNHRAEAVNFLRLSGLRSMEINQLKLFHVLNMKKKHPEINIHRKYNKVYRPLYTNEFNKLIDHLYENREIQRRIPFNQLHLPLFNFSQKTLNRFIQDTYLLLFKQQAPLGFGTHTFRYMEATNIVKSTKNLHLAKHFLNHNSPITTKIYIQQHASDNAFEINKASETLDIVQDIKSVLNGDKKE